MPGPIAELATLTDTAPDQIADAIGFDLATGRIRPDGRFVTATNEETRAVLQTITGMSAPDLEVFWEGRVMEVPQVPVPGLSTLMADLRARDLALGILTNADEAEARHHLASLGLGTTFDQVIGYDSGWGAKPAPHGALAFAQHVGLPPSEVLLVGDGMTDMLAAQGAGMRAVAVLTGTLDAAALAPHAEIVLDDIRALPAWLDQIAA